MEPDLRCSACGTVIALADDITTVAGRRYHRTCVEAPRGGSGDAASGPSGRLVRLRHWVDHGWGRSA